MTTTPHTDCHHPATKAARAKCRKERARAAVTPTTADLVASYHQGADLEEIAGAACAIAPEVADRYYDGSLDAEEFIAALAGDAKGTVSHTLPGRRARREAQIAEFRARAAALPPVEITDELRSAYTQYISDGLADTDGYYAPIDIEQFARLRA